MTISLAEATAAILKGSPLTWNKFQDHKAGAITLGTSGQRRLFEFLLKQPSAKVAIADPSLFDGLLAAWSGGSDPAAAAAHETAAASACVWRLTRLEASGFGGLTVFGGPIFEQWIGGENWCLEGQNGSGKSSFTNAILWALTGKRVREQDGLVDDYGERAPVYNAAGQQIGVWPPLVSYPDKASELAKDAETWVRLTFQNESGETATAFRKTTSPHEGEPATEAAIDPRLLAAPQLIETGLLMPARIPRIGFSNKSQSLYEAVKLLTGLDQLADIAEAARLLGHKAQPFLKYAKQQGADQLEAKFADVIAKAEAKANALGIDLVPCWTLGQKDIGATLAGHGKDAAEKAAQQLATLKSQIASNLDISQTATRAKIKDAVVSARAILNLGVKTIPEFQAWTALKAAKDGGHFADAAETVSAANGELETALLWHKRQSEDQRLRLKALAAHYYVTPAEGEIGVCPLCFGQLASAQQNELAAELAELKAHAAAAERQLADVCAALEKRLGDVVPAEMRSHHTMLAEMAPKEAYASAALLRFAQEEPFKSTLVGIATTVTATVATQKAALPVFDHPGFANPGPEFPAVAVALLQNLHGLERLAALVEWWSVNGQAFRDAWVELVQQKDEDGVFRPKTVAGQLAALEQAVDKAEPLDELSGNLAAAGKAADAWDTNGSATFPR